MSDFFSYFKRKSTLEQKQNISSGQINADISIKTYFYFIFTVKWKKKKFWSSFSSRYFFTPAADSLWELSQLRVHVQILPNKSTAWYCEVVKPPAAAELASFPSRGLVSEQSGAQTCAAVTVITRITRILSTFCAVQKSSQSWIWMCVFLFYFFLFFLFFCCCS